MPKAVSGVSDDRTLRAYFAWLESSQRFDYFVAAVSLALVGYLASNLSLTPIGFNSSGLELVAVVAIVIAAYAGLRRIEATIMVLLLSGQRLDAGAGAGALMNIFQAGGHSLFQDTGEVISAAEAARRVPSLKQAASKARRGEAEWAKRAVHWYRWRNRLLLGGLSALIIARLIRAYGH